MYFIACFLPLFQRGETISHAVCSCDMGPLTWCVISIHSFGTPNLVQWGHSYLSPSQRRGHLVVIVTGSPRKGGFKESLQYGHVYLCEVTVGSVYHGEVSEERSKVGYHTLYCTGSLEVKLVEQKTLLDHYQLNNAHQISWRAELAK